ncbi:MAG TPA: hypothetical protein DEP35_22300 [Deltaproteobacteria bacterium]|jgi:hypothetical protein|nr:hypothetical protein [Deltaproteobacteria bacterium]
MFSNLSTTNARAGITGVCPDGSFFVVQQASEIPCKGGKRVDPADLPPIRPEYLPRPYMWNIYRESADPNNPYNLVDSVKQVRQLRNGGMPQGDAAEAGRAPAIAQPGAGALKGVPSRSSVAPTDLGLTDGELRDLFKIIELSQQSAPAEFVKQTADGREALRVTFAHAASFEGRIQDAWSAAGAAGRNPVLLFSVVSKRPETFHATFTITQGPVAAQIEATDPHQLGVLQGHLGKLARDEVVLGYIVLPAAVDLSRPLDLYWDDRHISAQF